MMRFLLSCALSLSASGAMAAAVGGNGGLAMQYDGPPRVCSGGDCVIACSRVAQSAGNSFVARQCANECATMNHAAGGTTPGAFMSQCISGGIADAGCAQALANLAPRDPSGTIDDANWAAAVEALYAPGGPCSRM